MSRLWLKTLEKQIHKMKTLNGQVLNCNLRDKSFSCMTPLFDVHISLEQAYVKILAYLKLLKIVYARAYLWLMYLRTRWSIRVRSYVRMRYLTAWSLALIGWSGEGSYELSTVYQFTCLSVYLTVCNSAQDWLITFLIFCMKLDLSEHI